jgi:hypothetical protein
MRAKISITNLIVTGIDMTDGSQVMKLIYQPLAHNSNGVGHVQRVCPERIDPVHHKSAVLGFNWLKARGGVENRITAIVDRAWDRVRVVKISAILVALKSTFI